LKTDIYIFGLDKYKDLFAVLYPKKYVKAKPSNFIIPVSLSTVKRLIMEKLHLYTGTN